MNAFQIRETNLNSRLALAPYVSWREKVDAADDKSCYNVMLLYDVDEGSAYPTIDYSSHPSKLSVALPLLHQNTALLVPPTKDPKDPL